MKTKYIKLTTVLALVMAVTTPVVAQHTRVLTLQEAVALGLKNSKNLRISDAKIAEAVSGVQEAKDARLPDFNISGSYLRLSSATVDLKTNNNNNGNGGGPSPSQAVYGIANLSLPLYAGGRIKYGIESAKYLQQAAVLDAENDKEAVVFNITKAYVNLYQAEQAVAIVKENLSSALSRDSNFANLERNGILARNDLLKSELQTSNIALSLLDAENNYGLATVNMNLMLGLPENQPVMTDTAFLHTEIKEKTFEDYKTIALNGRKDIQAIGYRKKAAVTALKSAKAEAYPTLALTGGYVAADIPKVITITNAINFGVGVQYNLANLWKKNSRLVQARARETQVDASEEILTDAVKLSVNADYQQYLLSKKKISVYEKALEQATENYRITNNKYRNSLATITELLDANVYLLQSRLNIQTARADVMLAYQKLLQTTGSSTN